VLRPGLTEPVALRRRGYTMPTTNSPTVIRYACRPTKHGHVFAATTERVVRMLHVIDPKRRAAALAELRPRHPGATFVGDEAAVAEVFRHVDAFAGGKGGHQTALHL